MKIGMSVSQVSHIDLVVAAEQQGFDFCWVWDSPLLRSNLWSVLTLAADRTSTIAIGPGVCVPALRLAPETANGIATINRLAPGRTFLGLGTGNTALRTMGQRPMRLRDFETHVRVVKALLAGESVAFSANGITHDISFQSRELDSVDLDHPIPLHLAGFGPKAQALAGELGDGLITALPRGGDLSEIGANLEQGAARSGNDLNGFDTLALVTLLVLREGETLASDRVVDELGSSLLVNLHYVYDRYLETGAEPPAFAAQIWEEYLDFRTRRDADRDPSRAHANHYGTLDPAEARFVTPDLIRAFAIAGQPVEVADQLRALERRGLTGICFVPPAGREAELYREFAETVIPLLGR
jgi:5,10-methylenetetrahydromethanopterin reductase